MTMGEEDQKGAIPMDKKLLSDYIDACELIRETEQQIRRKLFEGLTWEESKKSDLIKEG